MADNVAITQGAGTTIAADEVGGAKFQRIKIALGADGVAVDAGAGAGASGTDTQRVVLASDDPAVVAVQIMDDWDESDRAKVNPIVGQAGIAAGAGNVGVTVPRVTLAADDPLAAVTKVDDAAFTPGTSRVLVVGAQADEAAPDSVDEGDAGALRMTLTRALHVNMRDATGTEIAATTLGQAVAAASLPVVLASNAALPAGTNNIGDVDVLTVPADPFGANADASSATGSISAKLRAAATALEVLDDWDSTDACKVVGITANPTSVYTRPNNTDAYAANDLVSNNVTAGSITVQTVAVTRVATGAVLIPRIRLVTDHTTGLDGIQFKVRLFTGVTTYSNGDNGAYAVATGGGTYIGSFTVTFEQFVTHAVGIGEPSVGSYVAAKLASGSDLYWDMQTLAIFTPQASKTFTLTVEALQD